MNWIREVVLDFAITILIIIAVISQASWLIWFVQIYTILMLVLKIISFFGGLQPAAGKRKTPLAPPWIIHLLYATNVIFLIAFRWWIPGAGWIAIWIISYITFRKNRKGKGKRSGRK